MALNSSTLTDLGSISVMKRLRQAYMWTGIVMTVLGLGARCRDGVGPSRMRRSASFWVAIA